MADNNPQAGSGRPLPKKEADTFKNVVKHYEMKQYKKAIKQIDSILKKYPQHGETLAMKGLTLNSMGKSEEAHALVKEGLRNDMRSHVCWHVYGLLHRADHSYNEAIKAYKQALRIDPENLQILRDLSMLQVQMRDLDGFATTRHTLMMLKSNAKVNWMAFAVARHLSGDLRGAIKVIDIYLGTLSEGSAELGRCFESSELALYKNSIIAEIDDNYREALDHLNVVEGIVVDRASWLMLRTMYQLMLGEFSLAQQSVFLMLHRGMTENHVIHSLYMCAILQLDRDAVREAWALKGTQTIATRMPLTAEQKRIVLDAYAANLAPNFRESHAVQVIPTTLYENDELRNALHSRCRKELAKGVPSLSEELRSYIWVERDGRFVRATDHAEVQSHPVYGVIVDLIDSYIASLQATSKLDADATVEEPPSTLFWAWFTRAALYELVGAYSAGIEFVDRCLEHTPTVVDAYELKARLLVAAGDVAAAAECVDKGRDLDRQDRYINNLTTRYFLQCGREEDALKTIAMFTRHEGHAEQNLFDMQCSWYELELADSLARKSDYGRALRKYAAIVKHFDDFNEDQFDFHAYCLRKVTLRSYVSVLRYEDEIYGHDYYRRAAAGIIRIYLHLYDSPDQNDSGEPDYSKMTAAERKKAKAIARKKKKQAEKHEESKVENGGGPADGDDNKKQQKNGKSVPVEHDPGGKELLAKNYLEECRKYSAMLVQYAPSDIETWILRYDVAVRRKKALMAVQALLKAKAIDETKGELLIRIVDFADKSESLDAAKTGGTADILSESTTMLLNGKSTRDFVQGREASIKSDPRTPLPQRCACAKALVATKQRSPQQASRLIVDGGIDARGVSVETCLEAVKVLQSLGDDATIALGEWKKVVTKRFPLMKPPLQ